MTKVTHWVRNGTLALAVLVGAACAPEPAAPAETGAGTAPLAADGMHLSSPAFDDGGAIPAPHACARHGGQDLSPALAWENVPAEAATLVLVVHDPHPTARNWVHWVLADVQPELASLPEGIPAGAAVDDNFIPGGARQLSNTSGVAGYSGPCPPDPPHPYIFTLYALSAAPALTDRASYAEIETALEGLVISSASLTGNFSP